MTMIITNNEKRWIKLVFLVIIMLFCWFLALWRDTDYHMVGVQSLLWLILYHVAIRILVGVITNHLPLAAFHPKRHFYKTYGWEKGIYDKLKVKTWKNKVPIFDQRKWDIHQHSVDEIIRYGCQAEVAHRGNILLSLISIFIGTVCDIASPGTLTFTAVTASAFDMIFVIIQRFNRPRLIQLQRRAKA